MLLSFIAAAYELYWLALSASFVFFITGLRQVHNACHYGLGVSKKVNDWVLFILSILMLGSMHVIQINHLRHHKYFPGKEDVEAMSAQMPLIKAFLVGPFFPILLHIKAIQVANKRQLRWIGFELLANIMWIYAVFFLFDLSWLKYHVIVMATGQCLTAFFAVWTVHHDCDPDEHVARTVRNKFKAKITFNMFFHLEHHLFPAVPTCHLHLLAQRLDEAMPDLIVKEVF
ncbi:MAG: fatty acid desaturase [Proteobacteria bacterium]|nr:fatty acid desaturase [Pseudomonadota bacterium]